MEDQDDCQEGQEVMAYSGGLKKWFKEDWRDVKTGKPCGRKKGEKRKSYPACRPKAVAAKMSSSEKKSNAAKKTSSKRISWSTSKRKK